MWTLFQVQHKKDKKLQNLLVDFVSMCWEAIISKAVMGFLYHTLQLDGIITCLNYSIQIDIIHLVLSWYMENLTEVVQRSNSTVKVMAFLC